MIVRKSPVPKDIEIAQEAAIEPIAAIAGKIGIAPEELITFGPDIAKVKARELLAKSRGADGRILKKARYVDVTAITPTPLGEGKTTTTIGLTQAFGLLGKSAACAIRQPSLGPTFGIKGGAAGGGYSQIVPMEPFNLHLTGDTHAVAAAHNLCSAALDARIYHENRWSDEYFAKIGLEKIGIDAASVLWNRVVDISDRALRHVVTGLGGLENGPVRESGFDIAVASELMAILALADSLSDLRSRVGRIIVAFDRAKKPVTAEDLGVAGALAVLLKDAINPNLLQTLEGQPAFVHAGPFANIAQGNSSVLADQIALSRADYVVTESGFGSDMGFEKFCDIKCRVSGMAPDVAVIVASVRALKMHGGGPKVTPGKPLAAAYVQEHLDLLSGGIGNLEAHIDIVRKTGIPAVVAINAFATDSEREWDLIGAAAVKAGADDALVCRHWEKGGEGALDLARAVEKACQRKTGRFKFFYPLTAGLKEKMGTIAREVYGADDVGFSPEAEDAIERYEKAGFGGLPICVAKTHLSLSHDPAVKGRPKGFTLPVRDVRLAAGAGFVYPLSGEISTMPALPAKPSFMGIDIDVETGRITGLS